jgi:hypothetical protein
MIGPSEMPGPERRSDPLLHDVLRELLVTTAGFLLAIIAVTLALDALSIN